MTRRQRFRLEQEVLKGNIDKSANFGVNFR